MAELKPTKPLSGFIELLPAQQRFVDDIVARMLEKLRIAGFEYIDLPAIERAEVLTDAEDWSETATQMFFVPKRRYKKWACVMMELLGCRVLWLEI